MAPAVAPEMDIEAFPTPISLSLVRSRAAGADLGTQSDLLHQAFEASLQALTSLLLAEYASRDSGDPVLDALARELFRPQIGPYVAFVLAARKRLGEIGHAFAVPEAVHAIDLARKTHHVGEDGTARPLLEALAHSRNRRAHHKERATPERNAAFEAALLKWLGLLGFLSRPCLYARRIENGRASWLPLHGTRIGPDAEVAAEVVLKRPDGALLALAPFAQVVQEADGAALAFFCSCSPKFTEYASVDRNHRFREAIVWNLLDGKAREFALDVDPRAPGLLLDRATAATLNALGNAVRDERLVPQALIRRPEMEDELRRFLSGNAAMFVLLGTTGIGKSTFLMDWSARMIEGGTPTLYASASGLDFADLESSLLRRLSLRGSLAGFADAADVPLIVVIDAVNEHTHPVEALSLVERLATDLRGSRVRFVVSLRTSQLSEAVDGPFSTVRDRSLYHPAATHDGSTRLGHTLVGLERGDPRLQEAYEAYRSLTEHSLRPEAAYVDLSSEVKALIASPGEMRLLLEAYHGQSVPRSLGVFDLSIAYLQARVFMGESEARLSQALAAYMFDHRATSVRLEEMWAQPGLAATMQTTAAGASAFDRLLDVGVLRRTVVFERNGLVEVPVERIDFARERVFETLLASLMLSHGQAAAETLALALGEARDYAPLQGAVEAVWVVASRSDGGDLACRTLNECPPEISMSAVCNALSYFAGSNLPAYQRLVEFLVERGHLLDGVAIESTLEERVVELGMERVVATAGYVYASWSGPHVDLFRLSSAGWVLGAYRSCASSPEILAAVYAATAESCYRLFGASFPSLPAENIAAGREMQRLDRLANYCKASAGSLLQRAFGTEGADRIQATLDHCAAGPVPLATLQALRTAVLERALLGYYEDDLFSDAARDTVEARFESGDLDAIDLVRELARHDIELNHVLAMRKERYAERLALEISLFAEAMPTARLFGEVSWPRILSIWAEEFRRDERRYRVGSGNEVLMLRRMLANAFEGRGALKAAREHYESAVEIAAGSPHLSDWRDALGALARFDRGRGQALSDFNQVLELAFELMHSSQLLFEALLEDRAVAALDGLLAEAKSAGDARAGTYYTRIREEVVSPGAWYPLLLRKRSMAALSMERFEEFEEALESGALAEAEAILCEAMAQGPAFVRDTRCLGIAACIGLNSLTLWPDLHEATPALERLSAALDGIPLPESGGAGALADDTMRALGQGLVEQWNGEGLEWRLIYGLAMAVPEPWKALIRCSVDGSLTEGTGYEPYSEEGQLWTKRLAEVWIGEAIAGKRPVAGLGEALTEPFRWRTMASQLGFTVVIEAALHLSRLLCTEASSPSEEALLRRCAAGGDGPGALSSELRKHNSRHRFVDVAVECILCDVQQLNKEMIHDFF